ncbi:glycosyltransferase [Gammaproteobacteria bacterium]|nr:glycosyltransferase [Gammaproteobacteria bacterium]
MLSIITVSHNSRKYLEDYVTSFLKFNSNLNAEIIIIENGRDENLDEIFSPIVALNFPVKIIKTKNNGFGCACNAGAEVAVGDFLLFVNPDTRFETGLDALLNNTADNIWGTGIVKNLAGSSESFDFYPEYKTVFTELFQISKFTTLLYPFLKMKIFPTGSFFYLSKKAFQDVDGFNESFFLYHEEAELARRLLKRYGPPMLFANIKSTHIGRTSFVNSHSALEHETEGFITYCSVTHQGPLLGVRLRQFRLLSILSGKVKARADYLKKQISKDHNAI